MFSKKSIILTNYMEKNDVAVIDICQKNPKTSLLISFQDNLSRRKILNLVKSFKNKVLEHNPKAEFFRGKTKEMLVYSSDILSLINSIEKCIEENKEALEALKEAPVVYTPSTYQYSTGASGYWSGGSWHPYNKTPTTYAHDVYEGLGD